MDVTAQQIQSFLTMHQLPSEYSERIKRWFSHLAEDLFSHQISAKRPFLVGLHGAQGSGKSTLAACLVHLLKEVCQCQAITISLDDFYLTKQQRAQLGNQVHPLLSTRGVPGTHDLALAKKTLFALKSGQLPVALPAFNKAIDDRYSETAWQVVNQQPDIIIFEGWCLGATPQALSELEQPINTLESTEDVDATWRRYVNEQLVEYQDLFQLVDYWLMLKAPDFDCIYAWRRQQEQALAARQDDDHVDNSIMNDVELARFIQFYQRLTEHCLKTLPNKMHAIIELDSQREIIQMIKQTPNRPNPLLIFTDLDGSLLDHHTYRHDDATPMLVSLEQRGIPVIPVSSKTRSEIEHLRFGLKNTHPFISENGAAVFIPIGYFPEQPEQTTIEGHFWQKRFVANRSHWQAIIGSVKSAFSGDYISFSDAGIDGIMKLTGLDVYAAARAAHRDFSEVIAWQGSPARQKEFRDALIQAGANVLQGGRFMHVSGTCDKGQALRWLSQQYQYYLPEKTWQTLAIGDSQNDIAMLQTADIGLVIPSPVHALPEIPNQSRLFVAPQSGPAGWAAGVAKILSNLSHSTAMDAQELSYG
ncbi:D-glycerate 3-kinase, plant type [Methylophaga frappieri]|uniref:D-glycerate 3-kinase, plant type n=1 Tax=Methylophaga frappieri (strain ATCC BAA-2434 / DSM 25690 / JAM7) TaxID=754477 RepID=I1YF84_METFJ|nr:HAD-IIB family hydrolase [Methylophaga frappieri]AFJ01577.1 D-glycerate 3-kinase, plant type [Methylophaga frappieri]